MRTIKGILFLLSIAWALVHFPLMAQQPISTSPKQLSQVYHQPISNPFRMGMESGVYQPIQVTPHSHFRKSGYQKPIQHTGSANRQIAGLNDERQLPLSPSGKLLSMEGFEVEFVQPQNANDPGGICGTQMPEVLVPPNGRVMAGCPFVVPCDMAVNRDANIPAPGDPIKYIQLRWTVVRNGGPTTNIDQVRVDALMNELNADFLPYRIQFCADPAIFVEDAALYALNVGTEDATLKTTYGATPNLVCNIYVVNTISNPSAGGYARFPYDPFGGLNIRGGVVMGRSNSNLGTHTLAHELGHTFGLHHTFRGVDEVPACSACYEGRDLPSGASSTGSTEGDWCEDTNPHPTNSYICGDAGTDGCAPGLPWLNSPVNNHMSYSFCTSTFSPQQSGRMHCMIDTYLNNWVAFGGGTCGAQPPTADFFGTPTTWQAPSFVTFTDQSVPGPLITNWEWNFDLTGIGGATPATFSGQFPPVVRYDTCDTAYTVRLIVSNANGADTLVRSQYIRTLCPAGECDTLDFHWTTPTSTPRLYQWAANNFVTGVPNTFGDIGFYERYLTPTPGVTTVGAVRVGLGSFLDADSSMRIQVTIYNDSAGFPQIGAGPLGGRGGIEPGGDLGIPGGNFFNEVWVPFFNPVTIPGAAFHVGVEIFNNGPADRLIVISSCGQATCTPANQGQGNGFNSSLGNGGLFNYLTGAGLDFDLDLIPMLGEWPAQPIPSFFQLVGCDTTVIVVTDTVLFNSTLTNMTVEFVNQGVILSDSNVNNLDTMLSLYTSGGPEIVRFTTINECGRTDTASYTLNYTFRSSPVVDFSVVPANPVCAGAPGVTLTATPSGLATYDWDFGDGTTITTGTNTTTHIYATPGLYYVTVVGTDAFGCDGEVTKLDIIEVVDCSINAPQAGFRQSPDSICVGNTVGFTDTSLAIPDPATNWLWDFGDGNFSLTQNPSHTYNVAGTYTVILVAGNAGGNDTAFYTMRVLDNPCLLPLGIQLAAAPIQDAVMLSWTVNEMDVPSDFEIERSFDGLHFQQIGQVAETAKDPNDHWGFVDRAPQYDQLMFYRIHLRDGNGDSQFSNTVTSRLSASESNWIAVYPNPSQLGDGFSVDVYGINQQAVKVQFCDVLGRILFQTQSTIHGNLAHVRIPTNGFSQGTYLVKVSIEGRQTVQKIQLK